MNTSSLDTQDLTDDINYINGLFNNFGMEEFPFKSIFSVNDSAGANKFSLLDSKARVCSLLIQLLHSKQKEEIFRKDSEDRIGRLMEDIRNLESHQKRQDERVKLQDRELVSNRQSQQLSVEKQRQMEATAHALRDELQKLKQIYVQKERQFQHELRKKEKEFEKLKDQLASVLKDMQLREQKSEIQYNSHQTVSSQMDINEESSEDAVLETVLDRDAVVEHENNSLRQIISFIYGSLVQLVLDLFPELELDQSILSLVESSPMSWIEETLAQKTEELFEILRDNLANVAAQYQQSHNQEQEKEIANLKSKCQSLNSTVSAQTETIKSQEQKLLQMEESLKNAESLEAENHRLKELLMRNEKNENNSNLAPGTPKWMKTHLG